MSWERANRELIAKLLTELEFEELLQPDVDGRRVDAGAGSARRCTTRARRRSMGHARVDPDVAARDRGRRRDPAARTRTMIVAVGAPALGVDPSTTAGLIGEIAVHAGVATRTSSSAARPRPSCSTWTRSSSKASCAGTRGSSPARAASGSRLDDLRRYAPEARRAGADLLAAGRGRGLARPAASSDLVPVHPWQWDHRIQPLYAGDIARGRIRFLGERGGRWLPQQSIRTLADADHPERHHLKLALSILNTSVYRGLPRDRTLAAPALSAWLQERVRERPVPARDGRDPARRGRERERRAPGVRGRRRRALPAHRAARRDLARVGRRATCGRGERAITLAALLHRDPAGVAFVEPLIARSGLTRRASGSRGCTRSRCRRCCTCSTATARRSRRTRRTACSCCATTCPCGSSSRTSSTT